MELPSWKLKPEDLRNKKDEIIGGEMFKETNTIDGLVINGDVIKIIYGLPTFDVDI